MFTAVVVLECLPYSYWVRVRVRVRVRVIERHGCMGSTWLPRTAWREYVPQRGGVTNLCYRRVTLDCNAQCQYRYIREGTTLGSMAG